MKKEMSLQELFEYVGTTEFVKRNAAAIARQKAGEHLSVERIAEELAVPVWFAKYSMLVFERRRSAGFVPSDSEARH